MRRLTFALTTTLSFFLAAGCGSSEQQIRQGEQSAMQSASDDGCPLKVSGTEAAVAETVDGVAVVLATDGDVQELRQRARTFATAMQQRLQAPEFQAERAEQEGDRYPQQEDRLHEQPEVPEDKEYPQQDDLIGETDDDPTGEDAQWKKDQERAATQDDEQSENRLFVSTMVIDSPQGATIVFTPTRAQHQNALRQRVQGEIEAMRSGRCPVMGQ